MLSIVAAFASPAPCARRYAGYLRATWTFNARHPPDLVQPGTRQVLRGVPLSENVTKRKRHGHGPL